MRSRCLNDMSALQSYAEVWNRMAAGLPFRSWEWLSTWWRHYGPSAGRGHRARELHVVCVFDEGESPVGFAPFYAEETATAGRVLRLLGDGEVCSEYLGVLADPGREEAVAGAVASHLADSSHASRSDLARWDLIQLEAVNAGDPVLGPMLRQFPDLDCTVHCRPGPGCWRVELPATWDEMFERLSKNQRRQVRRLLAANARRDITVHEVERLSELPAAFASLVDLHHRRWRERGQPGCFASERFLEFHREVAPQ
ncbi:MAG: hypothetical protein U1E05_19910, partial [Patescibacteria group bacterium]|nr:hypothetical protein [Patescibacteria group bacterium]